jgi:CubicO group peptidase (beta-lactamase class C family)
MRGAEMSYAGLNLTARDFAKLGELYRNNGVWQGRRIVGDHAFDLGYGYQWWIPAGGRGDYSAIGILNQLVHVDPTTRTTIVKLSANRRYGTSTDEATNRDVENVEFLRTIAQHAGDQTSAEPR